MAAPFMVINGYKSAEASLLNWTSKYDLSSTTKFDQNHIARTYKFGHT